MIVYSQGRYHDLKEPAVCLDNGGFLHGEGVFTTLRLYAGRAVDLAAHWQRLADHGRHLGLTLPLAANQALQVISELAFLNDLQANDMRLRVSLARDGQGSLLSLVPGPLPPDLTTWQEQGVAVIVLDGRYQRTFLPRLKTLQYLPSRLALREAERQGCPEAVICTPQGEVCEGAVSNFFAVRDGILLTPPDSGGILPGRTRALVLKLAADLGIPCREAVLHRDRLPAVDEAFLTNSVREIVPVIAIEGTALSGRRPGPVTRHLQQEFRPRLQQGALT